MALPPMPGLFDDDDADDEPRAPSPNAPLAERMRPRNLGEFVGQESVIGEGRVLRRMIEGARVLPSLILWGPPGSGKTTLARLLAEQAGARFLPLSAVFSGVKEVRAAIADAGRFPKNATRPVLFIDEIHRFNKAQQDALLPAVESGAITLIGATTENPSFEVNSALLSRARVVVLGALSENDIEQIILAAVNDAERGLKGLSPVIDQELVSRLAQAAGGDARVALTALESAVLAASPDSEGQRVVTEAILIESLGRARYSYDRQGEDHFNLVSALVLH